MIKRNSIIEQIKNRIAYHCNEYRNYYELGKGVIDYLAADIYADIVAMGGLLPPFKVGDKVYTLGHGNRKTPVEWEIVFIGFNGHYFLINIFDVNKTNTRQIVSSDIGETVFLTREEAEKALLERAADNGRKQN